MNYVLDSNIVSLLLRRDTLVKRRFDATFESGAVYVACPMVWFEVRRGLLARDAHNQFTRFVELFARFSWQEYNRNDWRLASELWKQRRVMGKPVEDSDLLIAVFARNRDAVLVTDNEKDFTDLGVTMENWTR